MYQIIFNFKGSRNQTIVEFNNFIPMYVACQEIKNVVDGDILTFKKDRLGYYRLDTSLLDINDNVLKTYINCKKVHTDKTILCHNNGVYFSYGNDAKEICNNTGIICHHEEHGFPKCSFPSYKLDEFLPMMVRKGMKICICDFKKMHD